MGVQWGCNEILGCDSSAIFDSTGNIIEFHSDQEHLTLDLLTNIYTSVLLIGKDTVSFYRYRNDSIETGIESRQYYTDGTIKTSTEFDEDGNIKLQSKYTADGGLYYQLIRVLDSDGYTLEIKEFDTNGKFYKHVIEYYTVTDKKLKTEFYDENGNLLNTIEH